MGVATIVNVPVRLESMNKNTLSLFVVVSILAFIGGCTPTTTTNTALKPIISATTETDISARQQALTILNSADISADSELADSVKLDAAYLFASAGDFQDSINTLETINPQNLNDRRFIDYSLLAIETYVVLFSMPLAAERLEQPRFIAINSRLSTALRQRILRLRAEVQFALGNDDQGFKALLDLTKTLKRKREIRAVHEQIWHQISRTPYRYLDRGSNHTDVILAGWLQLAAASRRYQSDPSRQARVFAEWRRRWRTHPAAKIPPSQFSHSKRWGSNPNQVAMLLPLQDQYKIPSYTLIDGFLEAYYQALSATETDRHTDREKAPEIRIYDTSKQPIQDLYNRAVKNGANMIIGPMRQSQVERLMTAPTLPVPTLSLNRLDNDQAVQPENLYQFGLSPLDELTQIADRAWNKGLRNIVLIVPDNSWGGQSAEFFNSYWTAKGGKLLEDVRYPSSVNDFTQLLKPPLQIDLSEQRSLQIKRFINSRVKYTARRRQDIDLVVMLGYPLKARQIKPALDFLYASDIPVVATSHIYNGEQQVGLDRDLSGVEFSSMPWTLAGHLAKDLKPDKQLHTAYRHLYAMGRDSFLLYRNMDRLKHAESPPIYGSTGLLSLKNNVVVREPKWAKFKQGKVVEIQY